MKVNPSVFTQTPAVRTTIKSERKTPANTEQDTGGGNFFTRNKTPLIIGGALLLATFLYLNRKKPNK